MLTDDFGVDSVLFWEVHEAIKEIKNEYGESYDIENEVDLRLEYLVDEEIIGEVQGNGDLRLFGVNIFGSNACSFGNTIALVASGTWTIFSVGSCLVTAGIGCPFALLSAANFLDNMANYANECAE